MASPPPSSSSSPPPVRAVVVGFTGAVGSALTTQLIEHERVTRVTLLGRRRVDALDAHAKVQQHVVDLGTLATSDDGARVLAEHDVAFSCLGTTVDQGEETFRRVDLEYPTAFARAASAAGVRHFHIVSSMGADAHSWLLYTRVKGQADAAVAATQFDSWNVWRPGLLGRGEATRFKEKVFGLFVSEMPVATLARAMLTQALRDIDERARYDKPWYHSNNAINAIVGAKGAFPPPPSDKAKKTCALTGGSGGSDGNNKSSGAAKQDDAN